MRVEFLDYLQVLKLDSSWRVLGPFRAMLLRSKDTELLRERIVEVPDGFETDFASVPRLPFVFLAAGDTAQRAAVLHDYLYSTGEHRAFADSVFLAAMKAEQIPAWRRYLMWAGVRVFGGAYYRERDEREHAELDEVADNANGRH